MVFRRGRVLRVGRAVCERIQYRAVIRQIYRSALTKLPGNCISLYILSNCTYEEQIYYLQVIDLLKERLPVAQQRLLILLGTASALAHQIRLKDKKMLSCPDGLETIDPIVAAENPPRVTRGSRVDNEARSSSRQRCLQLFPRIPPSKSALCLCVFHERTLPPQRTDPSVHCRLVSARLPT